MEQNKIVAGYYRLSKEDMDANEESNSITNQRLLIKDYVAKHQDLQLVKYMEFCDDGYSGSNMDRPAMNELLELVRQERVSTIIVKDFSRFARNYIEMGTYLEKIFPFMGIRFLSISDHYDSSNYSGTATDLEVNFKGLLADFYVKDQSVKTKTALQTKRKNGEYCSGSTPLGYRKNPENPQELIIVQEEAEIIRRVFKLTLERYSKMNICKLFNEEGIKTPSQIIQKRQKVDEKRVESGHLVWTTDMVRKILNNKSNYGCMVYGKTTIPEVGSGKEKVVPETDWKVLENHHEPIVSKDEFEQAQQLQLRHSTVGKKHIQNRLLTGFVKCGNCGRNLSVSKDYKGHCYYSCSFARGQEQTNCFCGKMDNKILEQYVLSQLQQEIQRKINHAELDAAARQTQQDLMKGYEHEIQSNYKAIEHIKITHNQNYEQYHEGRMTKETFIEQREALEQEKSRCILQIQELKEQINAIHFLLEQKTIPVAQMEQYLGLEVLTREMVKSYVEEIQIYDDGRIKIQWTSDLNVTSALQSLKQ